MSQYIPVGEKPRLQIFEGRYIRLYFLVIKNDYEPLVRASLIVVEAWGGWI